jgi:hypothetical protein
LPCCKPVQSTSHLHSISLRKRRVRVKKCGWRQVDEHLLLISLTTLFQMARPYAFECEEKIILNCGDMEGLGRR